MDSLNIAGKAVRLCIDNDESRVIEFYPTDVSFAENFYALAAEFEERQNDIKACLLYTSQGDLQYHQGHPGERAASGAARSDVRL